MKPTLSVLFGLLTLSQCVADDVPPNRPAPETSSESLVASGDFETSGAWNMNARDSNLVEVRAEAQSPFSNGTQGLHIHEEEAALQPPLITQDFIKQTLLPLTLSFDFKVNKQTAYAGGDGVLTMIMYMAATPAGTDQLRYSLMFTGSGKVMLLSKTPVEIGSYSMDIWYHVSAAFPESAGGKAAITLIPFGGSPTVMAATIIPFNDTPSEYRLLRIQTGFGAHSSLEDVYVDNISVEEPHPSSLSNSSQLDPTVPSR